METYEDILTALANTPLTIDDLAYQCKMSCVILNQRLDFLMQNDLVEEATANSRNHYRLTRRGTAIYKTLSIAKRLEKLQTNPNKPVQSLAVLLDQDEKETTRIQ